MVSEILLSSGDGRSNETSGSDDTVVSSTGGSVKSLSLILILSLSSLI